MIYMVRIPLRFNLTLQGARYILATMSTLVMSAIPMAENKKVGLLNTAALNPGIREERADG